MSDPTRPTAESLQFDLDASDAELAAGQVVESEIVVADLRACIERIEGNQSPPA